MDTLATFPSFETSRLFLRGLTDGDAQALQSLTNHPEITEIVHFLPTPFSVQDAQKLIEGRSDGQDRFVGVWFRGQPAMVAVMGVHLRDNDEIEIGYWVHPQQHRKGIAREALSALLAKLNSLFPHRTLIAECRPENQASWALLEKSGFVATQAAGHRPGRRRFIWQNF